METLGLMHFPLELKAGRIQSLEARMRGNISRGGGRDFHKTFEKNPSFIPI